jgi:hypothetical protein
MEKEYKIEIQESGKQTITYYINGIEEVKEHYANKDGTIVTEIRIGYTKHKDSL